MDFIYDIANTKSYGHVMVDINDWKSDSILQQINLKGKLLPTFITTAVKINSAPAYRPVPFNEGDTIALSAIATRISFLRPFSLPNDPNSYANVHLSQVLGYFKDNEITIDNFIPIYDKVVMKKIEIPASTSLQLITDNMSVGEVIKVGDGGFTEEWERRPMNIEVGSHVLIRDNVTTTLSIGGDEYYVTDDTNIVGAFKSNEYDISNVDVFGDISIFEEYEDDRIEGSILYRPVFNKDNDIAQTYQENVFKLVKSNKLNDGVYLMSRFDTEYIKFKNKDYFVIKNNKVMAKKEKETV